MGLTLGGLGAAAGALLKARGESIAVAESSAGGLINAALVAVPGASAYYIGGEVIYTPKSRAVFGIAKEEMANMRSASEPFAQLLARRVREKMNTTWGLAETGASGPTGNRYGDAAGHACIAVSGPVNAVITVETGSTDREANMWEFAQRALGLLEQSIGQCRERT
jgi:nicotinamide-nucleotide amidase